MEPSPTPQPTQGMPASGDYPRQLLVAILATPRPPAWRQYTVTVLVVAFVTLVWFSLQHSVTGLPFLLYMSAIFLISLVYGRESGFLSVALSVVALAVLFADPLFRLAVDSADDLLALALFALIGCGIALLTDALRKMVGSLQSTLTELAAADREKDILLREVHHRIRNDLQMIVMQLVLAKTQQDNLTYALDRAIERIGIISRVYERLRRQDRDRVVDAKPYLQDLIDDLQVTHVGTRPIRVHAHIEVARLDMTAALALGIVINELMTNAFKYAFPDGRPGRIAVGFRRSGEEYVLSVEDDGAGLSGSEPQGTGLGGQLVRQFAEQLDGRFDVQPGERGVRAAFAFPVERTDSTGVAP